MEPDEDEHAHPGQEELVFTENYEKVKDSKPSAKGNIMTDQARKMVKPDNVCSVFCGGKKCKYCTTENWTNEEQAIKGLFSHWVTDNILAMARPSNAGIKKYKILDQFIEMNIKTVINVQLPGEHAFCGDGNDASGFSYNPQLFMEKEIFFYNFGWDDFGVGSVMLLLDIVKVMQFSISLGKVAVHCHAGLGRTGLLIACYLVYNNRLSPSKAVHYVRSKRPGAIQTIKQVEMVSEFDSFIRPLRVIFAIRNESLPEFSLQQHLNRQRILLHGFEARKLKYIPKLIYVCCERLLELANRGNALSRSVSVTSLSSQKSLAPLNTTETLKKSLSYLSVRSEDPVNQLGSTMDIQRSRSFETLNNKNMKTIYSNSEKQCNNFSSYENMSKPKAKAVNSLSAIYDNERRLSDGVSEHGSSRGSDSRSTDSRSDSPDYSYATTNSVDDVNCTEACKRVGEALLQCEFSDEIMNVVYRYQVELNKTDEAWKELSNESDPEVIAAILWEWQDHLQEPIVGKQDLSHIKNDADKPLIVLKKIDKGTKSVIEYFCKVMIKMNVLSRNTQDLIIERILSHITHQAVFVKASPLKDILQQKEHWHAMKGKTAMRLFYFFQKLMESLVESGTVTNR